MTTMTQDLAALLPRLAALPAEDARLEARLFFADVVRFCTPNDGGPFSYRAAARWAVETLLPAIPAQRPDLDELLRFAGFGGAANKQITVRMLRKWDKEAHVPPADQVKARDGFLTPSEHVSLVRAGLLPGELPKTVRGMEQYLKNSVAGLPRPERFRRKSTWPTSI